MGPLFFLPIEMSFDPSRRHFDISNGVVSSLISNEQPMLKTLLLRIIENTHKEKKNHKKLLQVKKK